MHQRVKFRKGQRDEADLAREREGHYKYPNMVNYIPSSVSGQAAANSVF